MKTRISLQKDLKNATTPHASLIRKNSTAVLHIEIELLSAEAAIFNDGDYVDETDEPKYRDAAMGEQIALNLEKIELTRINGQGPAKLSIIGAFGTKVPYSPE